MSFWTTIKNIFTIAPKMATDVFDKDSGLLVKAGGFLNDLNFSEAEKAKYSADIADALSKHVEATLGESTVRSMTRRSISLLWIKAQLALVLMVAICIPFKTDLAEAYFKLATCDVMLLGTTAVILFFFGAYAIGTHLVKKN